jgi:hypothetical protein
LKLDDAMFFRLRRLAPFLDDVINANEVESAEQVISLEALAQLCLQLFDSYHYLHAGEVAQARLDSLLSR